MISIIITAFKEPNTIGKAIDAILEQKIPNSEIIVTCPDQETKDAIKKYKKVKHVQDEGKGKPAALNLIFKKAKGDILVLTDGDVFTAPNSIKELLRPFEDKQVGLVSSHPISIERRDTMLGFWSHLLTDVAHRVRSRSRLIIGSGYLMAIRKGIVESIPENALSDDAVISHLIYEKGYKTVYAPEAKVFVKYPTNFKDWIKQKKRSAGGYVQLSQYIKSKQRMRSFSKESQGIFMVLPYCKNGKQTLWVGMLVLARMYLWLLIFLDVKVKRKPFKQLWLRVESTK